MVWVPWMQPYIHLSWYEWRLPTTVHQYRDHCGSYVVWQVWSARVKIHIWKQYKAALGGHVPTRSEMRVGTCPPKAGHFALFSDVYRLYRVFIISFSFLLFFCQREPALGSPAAAYFRSLRFTAGILATLWKVRFPRSHIPIWPRFYPPLMVWALCMHLPLMVWASLIHPCLLFQECSGQLY